MKNRGKRNYIRRKVFMRTILIALEARREKRQRLINFANEMETPDKIKDEYEAYRFGVVRTLAQELDWLDSMIDGAKLMQRMKK